MNQSTNTQSLYSTLEAAESQPSTSGFVKASDLVRKSSVPVLKAATSAPSTAASTSAATASPFVSASDLVRKSSVPVLKAATSAPSITASTSAATSLSASKFVVSSSAATHSNDNTASASVQDTQTRVNWTKSGKSSSLISSPTKTKPSTVARKNVQLEEASSSSNTTTFFSQWV